MRLSKTTLIILAVVVFVAAAGILYMMYSRQLSEQENLKSQISTNQATLTKLVMERENVQAQLTKVEEQLVQKKKDLDVAILSLNTTKAGWPKEAESIEYDKKLFELAKGWDLQIMVVQTGETGSQNAQGVTFRTNTYNVSINSVRTTEEIETASGYEEYLYEEVGNILGFITSTVNDEYFATASIDLVNLSIPALLTDDDYVAGEIYPSPTSNITVTVFTYKGG
jgi:hypothetical protein